MNAQAKIHVILTSARPLNLSKRRWPLVAKAKDDTDHNNQELFRRHYLSVRQHAVESDARPMEYYGGDKPEAPALSPHPDNRIVVYGRHESSWQGEAGMQAGYTGTLDEAADLIRKVGEEIGAEEWLIIECIGDLPAVDPDAEDEPLASFSTEMLAAEIARRESVAA